MINQFSGDSKFLDECNDLQGEIFNPYEEIQDAELIEAEREKFNLEAYLDNGAIGETDITDYL